MQKKFSNSVATMFAAMFVSTAAAHPGHSPTDLAAEVSQPLAGPDHFVAFMALTSVLLVALRVVIKARQGPMRAALKTSTTETFSRQTRPARRRM